MNEKKGYDWYKTKTLGDLNKIRKRYGCIWCPKCRGRGTEERLLVEIFKIGLSEIVPCVRCRGRTMVAARKISDDEISQLNGYERGIVLAVRQYPGIRIKEGTL